MLNSRISILPSQPAASIRRITSVGAVFFILPFRPTPAAQEGVWFCLLSTGTSLALKQSLAGYRYYQQEIGEADQEIRQQLADLPAAQPKQSYQTNQEVSL
jgi:hypothetical protein